MTRSVKSPMNTPRDSGDEMDIDGNDVNNSSGDNGRTQSNGDKWPEDADDILEKIRCNSIVMSEYHKGNYFLLNSRLKYFRIPIIIISAFASVLNIGLQPFLEQQYISILCCLLSLVTGLIGSIEMFLQVQKKMENELINSRDFYLNAIEIFKVLSLEPNNRNGDGLKFLDAKFGVYIKMIENSNIMDKEIKDQLAPIDPKLVIKYTGNLNNAGVLFSRASHKVNKRVRQRVRKMGKGGKFSLSDLLFLRFFFGSNIYDEDDSSVDSEDRFLIYQDIMNKVHNKDIEQSVLEKMAPLLTFSETRNEIKIDERMKIYNMLLDSGKFDTSLINKMRVILIEEYFTKPSMGKRHNTSTSAINRYNSYDTMDENYGYGHKVGGNKQDHKTSLPFFEEMRDNKNTNIMGNTNEICDVENQYNAVRLAMLRPLRTTRGESRESLDSVHAEASNIFTASPIDD
jgi:hypothetical protein